jgi:hypothetical protein
MPSQFADHDALGCSIRAYAAALGEGTGAERIWWLTANRPASGSVSLHRGQAGMRGRLPIGRAHRI